MRDLLDSMAMQIFILDPLVTQCLFNRQGELASFLDGFDMLTCNYILYPYVDSIRLTPNIFGAHIMLIYLANCNFFAEASGV